MIARLINKLSIYVCLAESLAMIYPNLHAMQDNQNSKVISNTDQFWIGDRVEN